MFDVGAIKDKVIDKIVENSSKVDDKDKKVIKENIDSAIDGVQKKVSDHLKTADKVANSSEVNAIGAIAGP